jgi:hypothetical protein
VQDDAVARRELHDILVPHLRWVDPGAARDQEVRLAVLRVDQVVVTGIHVRRHEGDRAALVLRHTRDAHVLAGERALHDLVELRRRVVRVDPLVFGLVGIDAHTDDSLVGAIRDDCVDVGFRMRVHLLDVVALEIQSIETTQRLVGLRAGEEHRALIRGEMLRHDGVFAEARKL